MLDMFVILPLLAEQPVNAPKIAPIQANRPQSAAQQGTSVPAPIASVAPPETSAAQFVPASPGPTFNASGTSLPILDDSLKQAATSPEGINGQAGENWKQQNSANLILSDQVVLGNLAEFDRGLPQVNAAESDKKPTEELTTSNASTQPFKLLETAPKSESDKFAASILEQQKVLEQKLAEIVEQDQPTKEAQLQENLIATAIDYANQGQFEQARRLIHDPVVPQEIQLSVLNKINSLEAENTRMEAVKAAESIRLANEQRRWQQASFQARPIYNAPQTAINPINIGPISLSDRGLGLAYRTTPLGQEYAQRLARLKGVPGNGNLSLLFPLPAPAPITSGYGWRIHPIGGDQRFHSGVDIGAPEGTPVIAAYSGKVATADTLGGYGLAVVLEHNKGAQDTLYGHLSEILVRPGDEVAQGAVIGRVGSTGLSTGPHLHFELRQRTLEGKMETVDPAPQVEVALNNLVKSLQTAQRSMQKRG